MDAVTRQRLESGLREQAGRGDLSAVMTEALRGYGHELFGFLVGLARDREVAAELFASTCDKLWRALPGFRWESSFRVWAYTVARNELRMWRRGLRVREHVPLSGAPPLVAAEVRSTTAAFKRTEARDGLAELRAELDPDDQALIGLRVDRGLEWNEIAAVLADEEPAPTAAALRKRYERLIRRGRAAARGRGLL
jgi:RNA polymerase sigma-70 factor (ECF subfamily)